MEIFLEEVCELSEQSWRFGEAERKYVEEVLSSGLVSSTAGSMNSRLEAAFAEKMGLKYAITFNSGTTTLHTSLWALGVRYGDEVLIPALTVISCMNAVLYCNAIPVFVDVKEDTFLMDPDDMRRKITERTKAIMPVHLYGQVCDMDAIMSIANEFNLAVVEDCAQCFLGEFNGKKAGTFGHCASWSFESTKHITTGDGGIVATDDEELATRIRKLSTQGYKNITAKRGQIRLSKDVFQDPNYKRHDVFGFMYRLPEVAAAVGLAQVEKLEWFVEKRIKMALKYKEVMEYTKCEWLIPQKVRHTDKHSYWTFAARFIRNDISWYDFRRKFIEFGGDGIYAAWSLCYKEDSIPEIHSLLEKMGLGGRFNTQDGLCPVAEEIQPQLMQFPTNQKDEEEMDKQQEALYRAIRYFS